VAKVESALDARVVPEPPTPAATTVHAATSNLPAPPVRVTFPALLPDGALDDEVQPEPKPRWPMLTIGVLGLFVTCWLVWLLWLR
jgi:hypothetical protein